ncbi:MAG TPA: UDP-glucose/GDP-mannose dehydrogenase family protein [Acidimicrobiia bacterium]|jgi:UDPglucose 6-dehydrogenase|nr:UDP-glucose/GDP-mannose dehydrogenase family protein [Acidimicrobiia bacterium]
MRVAVVGAGYVGLTTAACFAHLGHDVVCADIDAERVARLQKGEVPILEAGLPDLLATGLGSRRLRFVVGSANAARDGEIVFMCVQTPQGADGSADLSYLETAVRDIAPVLRPGTVVVNKSTVPVGSTRFVQRVLSEAGVVPGNVTVASNPEFLREGQAVRDFLNPDRIVIGCEDPESAVRVSELYKSIHAPVLVTDPASAEMIKYASNAFLATKVSFINAIANLCEAVDADVREVAIGMGYDTRIGFQFLHPGPGYGGSCFPKDVAALLHGSRSAGYDFELLSGVVEVNRAQQDHMLQKVRDAVGGSLSGKVVGVWGLTFKADTDDLRDSPAVAICQRLIEEQATVQACDPAAGEKARTLLPNVDLRADAYDAAAGADAVVLLTEWDEFRWLDFERVAAGMRQPAIVDARNLLDPAAMRRRGFRYAGVGRR